jgi:hypothetical protein
VKAFAEERETKVTSVEEAVKLLRTDYAYETTNVLSSDLGVSDGYNLGTNGDGRPITRWAFNSLCSLLKIPTGFGHLVPEDLFEIMVRRLRDIEPFNVKLFSDSQGVIFNIKRARYHAPPLEAILNSMTGHTEKITVSVRGIQVTDTFPIQCEPKVGDIIKVGTHLVASETGGPLPAANILAYRLPCTNGAIANDNLGSVKWGNRKDGLDDFLEQVHDLSDRGQQIANSLLGLPKRSLTDLEFSRMWNQVRTIYETEQTDKIFGVVPEERKVFLAQAILTKKENSTPVQTNVNAWKVYNDISFRASHGSSYVLADSLKRIAGSLLN